MQQATTIVSCVCESRFLAPTGREGLSLQIVRNWLVALSDSGEVLSLQIVRWVDWRA